LLILVPKGSGVGDFKDGRSGVDRSEGSFEETTDIFPLEGAGEAEDCLYSPLDIFASIDQFDGLT
jgi:hypothetical protein